MSGALEQRAQLGRRLKHAPKIVAGEDEEQTGGTRADRGGARNVVDERDLAEKIAVLQHTQQAGAAIARAMSKATLL
jgi:ABC-type phosphonate transport system ATPase subunit